MSTTKLNAGQVPALNLQQVTDAGNTTTDSIGIGSLNVAAVSDATKIITILGDSITVGYNFTDVTKRWPKQVCDALGYVENNLGVGGSSVHGTSTSLIPIPGANDAYLIIAFGTNDRGISTPSQFQSDLSTFVSAAISKGWAANRIFLPSTPGYQLQGGTNDTSYRSYNTSISNVATALGCTYVDMYSAMITGSPFGPCSNMYLTPDGTHPNDTTGTYAMTSLMITSFPTKFNITTQKEVVNGTTELSSLKLRQFNPITSGNLIGVDRYGNSGVLTGLPDKSRTLGQLFLGGGLLQDTASVMTGATVNDHGFLQNTKLYQTNSPGSDVYGFLQMFDGSGQTRLVNSYQNGSMFFTVSGGVEGAALQALTISPLGTLQMPTGSAFLLKGDGVTNYGSLNLFDGTGISIFKNTWNVGVYQWFMSNGANDGTTVKMMSTFAKGRMLLQNGGTHTDNMIAKLELNSTTEGFLVPRMTTTQRNLLGGVLSVGNDITGVGSGYTTVGTIVLTVASADGSGSGATIVPTGVVGGSIAGYTVTNPGQGYLTPITVTVSGGGGTGGVILPGSAKTITMTEGLLIYNTSAHAFNYFNGTIWQDLGGIAIDSATTPYTKSTLNTAYPNAIKGFKVIAVNATTAGNGFTYVKLDNSATGNWAVETVTQLL